MGDFLRGMVRALKPRLVVETGSHIGRTSREIALALRENRFGRLITCEPDSEKYRIAELYSATLPEWVGFINCPSSEIRSFIEDCDLLFSDSDTNSRKEEVSWLKPGALAVVHDTYVYPFLGEFVTSQGGILFDTPRGFGVIRK